MVFSCRQDFVYSNPEFMLKIYPNINLGMTICNSESSVVISRNIQLLMS